MKYLLILFIFVRFSLNAQSIKDDLNKIQFLEQVDTLKFEIKCVRKQNLEYEIEFSYDQDMPMQEIFKLLFNYFEKFKKSPEGEKSFDPKIKKSGTM